MIPLGPDPELTRRFGNEDVLAEKRAGRAQLATRVAMGLLGYGMGQMELRRQQSVEAEAEAMNQAFQAIQSIKMQQARENAHYTRPPIVIPAGRLGGDIPVGFDTGMVRMASVAADVGADLAKEALSIAPLIQSAKGLLGGLGAVGKALPIAGAVKAPTLAGAASAAAGAVSKPAGLLGEIGSKVSALPGQAKKMWEQSGINTLGGAKRTALGLGLGAAALYGGSKLLRGGLNAMSGEAHPAQFGSQSYGGSRVANGINEYGQPDLRAPFM